MPKVRKKYADSSAAGWLDQQPGVRLLVTRCGSGHNKLEIFYKDQKRTMFEAYSTSDRARAGKNNVAQARRLLREMGWGA